MRYTQGLKNYHNKKHRKLAYIVIGTCVLAIAALVLISHTNALSLISNLLISTSRVVAAYLITLPIALAIVIGITRNEKLEDFFVPVLDVSQSFPAFAILPLVLAVAGNSSLAIITFLVLEILWPILFTTLSAIKNLREDLGEAAEIFQAHGVKKLFNFTLPAIFPAIVTGSIVGWGEAWEAIIGAELIAGSGIGNFISIAYQNQNKQIFTFSIIILMLFIFILNRIVWLPLLKRTTQFQTD